MILAYLSLGLFFLNIDAEVLDLNRPELACVWQWGDDLLFVETNPPKLVLVSKEGLLKATYDKHGQAPGELMFPRVFGIDDRYVYLFKYRSDVQVFDKQLKFVKKLPSLHSALGSSITTFGISTGKDQFAIMYTSGSLHHAYGIVEVGLTGKDWRVIQKYFPFNIEEENRGQSMPEAKNPMWQPSASYLFRAVPLVFKNQDEYVVPVYKKPWKVEAAQPIMQLHALLDDIQSKKDKKFRCFIDKVGVIKNGFVVEIVYEITERVAHDYFDINGGFVRRDFDEYYILPVRNADMTLKLTYHEERDILTVLK